MNSGIQATFSRRYPQGAVVATQNLFLTSQGVTIVFGPSGAGKSTLLRCLAGIDRPDSGRIQFKNRVWFDSVEKVFVPARDRNVGFVPQEYALFPHLSVTGNILYGIRSLPSREQQGRLAQTLRSLDLETFRSRMPGTLSGGQQQRVALARAIIRQPDLLLLDEPLAALDAPLRSRLRSELRQLLVQLAIPALVVTHDRKEAIALGDQIVVLDRGQIVQTGPVHDVFNRPAHLSVAGLLSVETVQPGRIVKQAGGLISVQVGAITLAALSAQENSDDVNPSDPNPDVHVCIRAEDVILMRNPPGQSSARNCLAARVQRLIPEGATTRIELDCGFPLVAILTRQACQELDLQESHRVYALVKAPHIQLVAA